MKNILLLLTITLLLSIYGCSRDVTGTIDISGKWTVALDSTDSGIEKNWHNSVLPQPITLPGTTDDAGLGFPNTLMSALEKPQLSRLTRRNSYIGAAWYSREVEIPEAQQGKDIILNLERVIWQTEVWVDGEKIPSINNSLIAPHRFDLTGFLVPGKRHRLTVRVDNRKFFDTSVNNLAHAYTDDTQIIWNGILGEMTISCLPRVRVDGIRTTPDISRGILDISLDLYNNTDTEKKTRVTVEVSPRRGGGKTKKNYTLTAPLGTTVQELKFEMGEMKLWSEFDPNLYRLTVSLDAEGTVSRSGTDFGIRDISSRGSTLTVNGRPLFLRGTLECCIFPLTGYPPMNKGEWSELMRTAREWGINHLRFHSWCPPRAAFEAADEAGMYLQAELPVWSVTVGEDRPTVEFMYAEAARIIREYGNHPSFCFFSMGNELQGDMSVLAGMVDSLKSIDKGRLYTNTSFTFEYGYGDWPEPNDDFFITQWTKKGWVRGQGVFNSEPPSFDADFNRSVEGMTVPLVTHEIGQYAVYPNLDEIPKYTGVLEPLNFISVAEDLENKGLRNRAADYTYSSGRLAAILYKEEIERAMKTDGISGFQLLDLHDFPGQGTALVGLLDAFWDTKGFIEADEFRQYSAPVVPLANFPKAVYYNDEKFSAAVDVANYSDTDMEGQQIAWSLEALSGRKLAEGSFTADLKGGVNKGTGFIEASLEKVTEAQRVILKISLPGSVYGNSWNLWIYPRRTETLFGDIIYTQDFRSAMLGLEEGKKVLFNPPWEDIDGLEGKFVPVFWSPVHFPKQAGTMGLLCDPLHPALKLFPTEKHSDWQWWDLCINSTTVITDGIEGGRPVVEVIDNFTNNRRLAMIYECSVGEGKLLFASCDLTRDLDERPAAGQMLYSLVNYMNSDGFDPPAAVPATLGVLAAGSEGTLKQDATSIY